LESPPAPLHFIPNIIEIPVTALANRKFPEDYGGGGGVRGEGSLIQQAFSSVLNDASPNITLMTSPAQDPSNDLPMYQRRENFYQ